MIAGCNASGNSKRRMSVASRSGRGAGKCARPSCDRSRVPSRRSCSRCDRRSGSWSPRRWPGSIISTPRQQAACASSAASSATSCFTWLALSGASACLPGRTARSLALSTWGLLIAGLGWLGGGIKAAAASVAAKVHALAPSVGHFISASFGGIAARARDASRATGNWLGAGLASLAAKTNHLAHRIGEGAAPALSAVAAKGHTIAPALFETIGKAGRAAGTYAKAGACARTETAAGQGPSDRWRKRGILCRRPWGDLS